MSSFRLPLVASILGHAGVVALLILFAAQVPPVSLPEPMRKSGIEVMLTLPEAAPPPEPVAEMPPPTPEPPPPELPPPPAAVPEPEPPPPPKPVVHKPVVKPPPPHRPQPLRTPPPEPTTAAMPTTAAVAPRQAPTQTAMIPQAMPAPRPAPVVSGNYRAALSAWLESHKRYPETARWRGEEGRAVLRFVIDRSGRVVEHTVVKSSGFTDLDAAIEEMIRGATLPPFPAGMTQPRQEFTVNIRYHFDR